MLMHPQIRLQRNQIGFASAVPVCGVVPSAAFGKLLGVSMFTCFSNKSEFSGTNQIVGDFYRVSATGTVNIEVIVHVPGLCPLRFRNPRKKSGTVPENNSSLGEVVGGHFHLHLITGGNTNEMLAHLATDMGKDFVPVFQFDTVHGSGQHLVDHSIDLNEILIFFSWHTKL